MSGQENTMTFNHILGQGRVNQLGGVFINGRPLPQAIRLKIIEMANSGIKPCQISRQLRVSHGAVSKILNRYQETGSISPGQIGGNPRQRVSVQSVEKQLLMIYDENPGFCAAELRQAMIEQGICSRATAPTVASINRFVRSRGWNREKRPEKKRLSHSIDSILGISIDDSKSSSSDEDSISPEARRNRTSFTPEQLDRLESAFKANTYPDGTEREQIAKQTGLTEEKIMTWFSNRRARCRKHLPVYPMLNAVGSVTPTSSLYSQMTNLPMLLTAASGMSPLMFPPFVNSN
ncbi:unnamed protein product [Auanema sp. JU1783]|nr:unnamed protein product [Auanema sp. JU1783]